MHSDQARAHAQRGSRRFPSPYIPCVYEGEKESGDGGPSSEPSSGMYEGEKPGEDGMCGDGMCGEGTGEGTGAPVEGTGASGEGTGASGGEGMYGEGASGDGELQL